MAIIGVLGVLFLIAAALRNVFGDPATPDDPITAAMKANGTYPYVLGLTMTIVVGLGALLIYEIRKLVHARRTLARLKVELQQDRAQRREQLQCLRIVPRTSLHP